MTTNCCNIKEEKQKRIIILKTEYVDSLLIVYET